MRSRTPKNGPHCRWPPLASALAGGDAVAVESAGDLSEAASLCALAAEALDHVGWERRPAACAGSPPPWRPRLLGALGQVALELSGRDQPRAPLGLYGRDRWHDTTVERREADAECLRGLLARVHETLERVVELGLVQPRHADRSRGVPLLLLTSASLPPSRHRSPPRVHPYSNSEADLHRMMHLCLARY